MSRLFPSLSLSSSSIVVVRHQKTRPFPFRDFLAFPHGQGVEGKAKNDRVVDMENFMFRGKENSMFFPIAEIPSFPQVGTPSSYSSERERECGAPLVPFYGSIWCEARSENKQ